MPAADIEAVLTLAEQVKQQPQKYEERLRRRNLLMLFQKTSTRTRLSFELGMQELGGRSVVMDWDTSNFAISPIRYEARYVSRHVHVLMARLLRHEDVQALAESAPVPVINGCCERYHPTQGLADLLTVREHVDVGALEDVIARISHLCDDIPEIRQLEINPILVAEHGANVLQARMTLARSERFDNLRRSLPM